MALSALALPSVAGAQAIRAEGGVQLRPGGMLQEDLPQDTRRQTPTFVFGEKIEGTTDGPTVIEGDAELRRHDGTIRADRIEHDASSGDTKAEGNVRIQRNGDRFRGPYLEINANTGQGHFDKPEYELLRNEGVGDASRIDFVDKEHMQIHEGRYSTCPRPPGGPWKPDWLVRGKRIDLDQEEGMGTAYAGVLEFQGVPIMGAPYLTFPITDERKTGFLPPTLGMGSTNGFTVKAPYYFNLAPNYDLTLTPTLMAKRGVDVEGEFRYLRPSYSGVAKLAVLPSDKLRDETRWYYLLDHSQLIPVSRGTLRFSADVTRVGDADYWRDFDRLGQNRWARLLPGVGGVNWSYSGWNVSAAAVTYQALQTADSWIEPPYDQLPKLAASYRKEDMRFFGLDNWEVDFSTEATKFRRSFFYPSGEHVDDSGDRFLVKASLSHRWQAPGWFVQPRARVNFAQYQAGGGALGARSNQSRAIPTFSLDSGLLFERDVGLFGRQLVQTLEPRAFLTYTPFKDQSTLPNYDSAALDFNMMSMFHDDIYGGNDRISDMKAMSLGVSSRLIDAGNGAELMRLGLAQRYYFDDINVTLPGRRQAIPKGLSDMLVAARVQWTRNWAVDTNVQFNHETRESSRKTIGVRYTPGDYRVLSLAYRVQRDVSEQVDVGWQWPLSDLFGNLPDRVKHKAYGPGQWYGVGRVNYSMTDKKPLEAIAGFEYDAGCWLGRVVLERRQTSRTTHDKRIMFQLELSGFASLGGGALQTLGSNIPRYKALRDGELVPSRFENYD